MESSRAGVGGGSSSKDEQCGRGERGRRGGEGAGRGERLKQLFAQYGMTGVAVHMSLSVATYSAIFSALMLGCPPADLAAFVGYDGVVDNAALGAKASTAALAYLIYKVTLVFRAPITLAATPVVHRLWHKHGPPARTRTRL